MACDEEFVPVRTAWTGRDKGRDIRSVVPPVTGTLLNVGEFISGRRRVCGNGRENGMAVLVDTPIGE